MSFSPLHLLVSIQGGTQANEIKICFFSPPEWRRHGSFPERRQRDTKIRTLRGLYLIRKLRDNWFLKEPTWISRAFSSFFDFLLLQLANDIFLIPKGVGWALLIVRGTGTACCSARIMRNTIILRAALADNWSRFVWPWVVCPLRALTIPRVNWEGGHVLTY